MASYHTPYNQSPSCAHHYGPPGMSTPTTVPYPPPPHVGVHADPQPLGGGTFAAPASGYMLNRPPKTPQRLDFVRKLMLLRRAPIDPIPRLCRKRFVTFIVGRNISQQETDTCVSPLATEGQCPHRRQHLGRGGCCRYSPRLRQGDHCPTAWYSNVQLTTGNKQFTPVAYVVEYSTDGTGRHEKQTREFSAQELRPYWPPESR